MVHLGHTYSCRTSREYAFPLTLTASPFGILARRGVLAALEVGSLRLCHPIRTATVLLSQSQLKFNCVVEIESGHCTYCTSKQLSMNSPSECNLCIRRRFRFWRGIRRSWVQGRRSRDRRSSRTPSSRKNRTSKPEW